MKHFKILSILFSVAFLLSIGLADLASAKGRGGGKSYSSHSSYRSQDYHSYSGYSSAQRDSRGHIKRSSSARHQFMKESGYPDGRPGYVIDHVVPLKRGGPDTPSNMQWQTKEDAKAKDKWE